MLREHYVVIIMSSSCRKWWYHEIMRYHEITKSDFIFHFFDLTGYVALSTLSSIATWKQNLSCFDAHLSTETDDSTKKWSDSL